MATTTRQHIEMTRLDSSGNINILYPKNTLGDVYTDSTSGVTVEGKVMFYGTCSTDAATAAKIVNAAGFKLVAGAHITVKFDNAITVANATLNVNSTGAKNIYYEGTTLKANVIRAGASVEFVYDGIQYCALAGVNPAYVSNSNTTKFYLLGTPENINGVPSAEYFDTGVYVSTTSGQIVATSFSGSGDSLTNLNASNISSGTLGEARLPSSGATAGSYGPSDDEETTHGGNITVPSVTVDAYGRITEVKNVNYKLPTLDSADTKVTNTLNTTTKAYVTGTTSNETNTGTQVFDTGVYLDTTEGRLTSSTLMTGTCYLGSSTSNYINGTNYTGTAAKVGTLSGWLVDSCASASANGVTNKALTANQGYLLQNQIDTLNSNLWHHNPTIGLIYDKTDSNSLVNRFYFGENGNFAGIGIISNDGSVVLRRGLSNNNISETVFNTDGHIYNQGQRLAYVYEMQTYLPLSGGYISGNIIGEAGGIFTHDGNLYMHTNGLSGWLHEYIINHGTQIATIDSVLPRKNAIHTYTETNSDTPDLFNYIIYNYGNSNFAAIGANQNGDIYMRAGVGATNHYKFTQDGKILVNNAKVLTTSNMSLSGTTLTITL